MDRVPHACCELSIAVRFVECLEELASWPEDERPQLEVETYAWDALPDGAREGQALVDGIAREVEWCAGAARRAGFVRAGGVA
jgi:hypothetical protein